MDPVIFRTMVAAEAQKTAFVGTALKFVGKNLFRGANAGTTGVASAVGRGGLRLGKTIVRNPMRSANVGFSGAILHDGLASPTRVSQRIPNAFNPQQYK